MRSLCARSEHVGRGGCCGDRPSAAWGHGRELRPHPEVLPVKCPHRCPWRLQTVSGDKAMVGAKPEGTGQKPRGSERRLSRWSTDRIIIHARRFKTLFMELLTVEEVLVKSESGGISYWEGVRAGWGEGNSLPATQW